jgi:hypothetical protein
VCNFGAKRSGKASGASPNILDEHIGPIVLLAASSALVIGALVGARWST